MANKEKTILIFGRIASTLSVLMYVSYIPQIMNNLAGNKGNPIQPMVAMVNCIFWVIYASMQKKKDYPIIIANVPGVFLGALTFITALM
ncbi:SemiSWEET family transporter [Enterococcus sp.]|uniref:SemiSWEET family transporter n=1 Tax=Enterococcus sp. TaxID=35783 RepID=UPI0029150479|nr:SemiSWEET family transporter [Enterococcus sp.]MDU5336301.1 SemiSWEET family transporter [Enterococcus sp.]